MTAFLITTISTVSVLLIITVIAAYLAYRYTFYLTEAQKHPDPYRVVRDSDPNKEARRALADAIVSEQFTDVRIISHDGLSLRGRVKIVAEGAPFIIMCHGYRSTPLIDFAPSAPMAIRLGYNVLLIDQRAHGESEGRNLTFGVKECRDVIAWSNYVSDTYGAEVILLGNSMGAATVLMCASREDLHECVKGIIADCSFNSAKSIIKKELEERGFPAPKLSYLLARLGARLFGGFDPNDSNPKESIMKARVPVELIHGEADRFVPYYMGDDMHKASGVPLHSFKDATHGTSSIFEPQRYEHILSVFCRSHFSDNKEKEM